ncbi:LysR family transcriptional regulator [Paraburkholderia piptadeniae]|uniref:LysR family transcriptional regulator n=1 Tax=Paraburkholderia piptadeniae TaxID=1701573 RepID=A0A1N7S303_9BURK|nr:LysR family transcriptional regulator [Paraburkholderia piptadeniae]SIT41775.1 LysR family transcriptional regulator [Paraburkholderia piptadeniae]
MDPSKLPLFAWFAQIARHGSFTKAAAEMGVSRAALSQNLKTLEDQLNVKLIYRTTREMSLTEEGQRLFDQLQPALGAIEQAVRGVGEANSAPAGLLRVNTSRIAARSLIEPHLAELFARYPELKLELVMDDGFSNIIADGCDAGIRMGESLAAHVVAVPISPMLEMAVVASPEYFRTRGVPETPADLTKHDCVAYRHSSSGAVFRWEFTSPEADGHAFVVEPQGTLITNDDDSMIRAALQGAGLVQHVDIAVRQQLDDGSLVRVLRDWCKPFAGFYLYVPSRDRMPPKVRAFTDFLIEKRDVIATTKRTGKRPSVRLKRQKR